jgi:hypothetical protein
MPRNPFGNNPSTYLAFFSWAATGFMGQPTLASLVVHGVNALVLAGIIWLAHFEGRKQA